MQPTVDSYPLASGTVVRRAIRLLRDAHLSSSIRREKRTIVFLDTFDARLRSVGARLAVASDRSGLHLLWKPKGEGVYRRAVDEPPAFRWELPEGMFRDEIGSRIDVRRLLPLVEVEVDERAWEILDASRKTVVRVIVEGATAVATDRSKQRRRLGAMLRLIPVRGYADAFGRVRSFVEQRIAEAATNSPGLLDRALDALEHSPPPPCSKSFGSLEPAMRSDEAMKQIFRALLQVMLNNEPGARADIDTEFLHDYRVAARRTRTGLAQVPGVFPVSIVRRLRTGLSWLGGFTGPVRDLDVFGLQIRQSRRWEPLADDLPQVASWLGARHRLAHRRLVRALDSVRYRNLVDRWREYLDRAPPKVTSLPNASRPILDVASERILRARKRVLDKGRKVDDRSSPDRLHRLRIECKKLRYLLEFFSGLYREGRAARLVAPLKKLQNNLGDFNDLAVQRGMLAELVEERRVGSAAAARIREEIDRQQLETRRSFQLRFDAFAGRKVDRLFRRLREDATP